MTDPTDRLGTLNQTDEGWQLRFERHLDRSPTSVWRAFVDPDLIAAWFPTSIEGDLVAGAPLRFEIKDFVADPFEGTVVEVDEPHLLCFRWGPDVLRFELAPSGSGTRLRLLVLLEVRGKAARDGAGWHECLDRLAVALSADGPAPEVGTWSDLQTTYAERFGPEAATIGPPDAYYDAQR